MGDNMKFRITMKTSDCLDHVKILCQAWFKNGEYLTANLDTDKRQVVFDKISRIPRMTSEEYNNFRLIDDIFNKTR